MYKTLKHLPNIELHTQRLAPLTVESLYLQCRDEGREHLGLGTLHQLLVGLQDTPGSERGETTRQGPWPPHWRMGRKEDDGGRLGKKRGRCTERVD